MKRFVLLIWDLHDFRHIELSRDENHEVRVFARKKEALDHAKTIGTLTGFNYRAVSIQIE